MLFVQRLLTKKSFDSKFKRYINMM